MDGFAKIGARVNAEIERHGVPDVTEIPQQKEKKAAPTFVSQPSSKGPSSADVEAKNKKSRAGLIGVVGVIAALLVIIKIATSDPDGSEPSQQQPGNSQMAVAPPTAQPQSATGQEAPTAIVKTVPYEEEIPVSGRSGRATLSELRYCEFEGFRIDQLRGLIHADSNFEVEQFNATVRHFNESCINIRYLKSDMSVVQRELAQRSPVLRVEAGERYRQWKRVSDAAENMTATSTSAGTATGSQTPTPVAPTIVGGADAAPGMFNETNTVHPSFDCTKARSDAEHLICNDATLAALDQRLAVAFANAKAVATDQAAFRERTRGQWNYREKYCHDTGCLMRWYQDQQTALDQIAATGEVP